MNLYWCHEKNSEEGAAIVADTSGQAKLVYSHHVGCDYTAVRCQTLDKQVLRVDRGVVQLTPEEMRRYKVYSVLSPASKPDEDKSLEELYVELDALAPHGWKTGVDKSGTAHTPVPFCKVEEVTFMTAASIKDAVILMLKRLRG